MIVLLSRRARLYLLKGCPYIVDYVPPLRKALHPFDPLLHPGPLCIDYLLGVGTSVLLQLMMLGLGEPTGEPGNLGHRVCLALYRFVSLLKLLPNSDDQECQQHSVHDAYDGVDEASDVVVLLALLGRDQA